MRYQPRSGRDPPPRSAWHLRSWRSQNASTGGPPCRIGSWSSAGTISGYVRVSYSHCGTAWFVGKRRGCLEDANNDNERWHREQRIYLKVWAQKAYNEPTDEVGGWVSTEVLDLLPAFYEICLALPDFLIFQVIMVEYFNRGNIARATEVGVLELEREEFNISDTSF